ncbi:MAG: hypothetical protein D6683_16615, partial [Actinomyces sp.]
MNPAPPHRSDPPVPDRPRHLGLVRWLVGTATATAAVLAVTLGGPVGPGAVPETGSEAITAGSGTSPTASTPPDPGATAEPDTGPIDPDAEPDTGPIDPDA